MPFPKQFSKDELEVKGGFPSKKGKKKKAKKKGKSMKAGPGKNPFVKY